MGMQCSSFRFEVLASDPDKDTLFYSWEFGDGKSSEVPSPVHTYNASGTYEPKVTVSDRKGGSDVCSTAWVVVSQ